MRPFREDDVTAYTSLLQTREVRESLHLPASVGRTEAWGQMAGWLGQWVLRGTGQWAVEEKTSGAFVGRAGTHWPEREDWPGMEIGWALHPDQWGKGYATEAGAAAVSYALDHFDVEAVYSVILPENHRSQAVATRLGFSLVEERIVSHFPAAPHGIWRRRREVTPSHGFLQRSSVIDPPAMATVRADPSSDQTR
jgi:[ribosomal protein S5]-alanine N-acetyltransferase